jgi:tRNA threonylcarbamoyladenosine biosynthesis protein TsaE
MRARRSPCLSVTWSATCSPRPGRANAAAGVFRYRSGVSATIAERVVVTDDAAATRTLAARLASVAEPGDLLCLVGGLGAGKTQFAKGFAAGLGVTDVVNSPSFVLMTEYEGRLPVFHLDLYRIDDASDAIAGGLLDERQSTGVTLIEWAERLGPALPHGRLDVLIGGTGDEPRTIHLQAGDARHHRYLEAVEEAAA